MDYRKYTDFAVEQTLELLRIDSPTSYTFEAAAAVKEAFENLGYAALFTNKGGVIVDFGGDDDSNALLFEVHIDTLGGIVSGILPDGRLRINPLGGLSANNTESENVRVITKFDGSYEGTFQLHNPSTHVNKENAATVRTFDNMEVVLDEFTTTAEQTRDLGIEVGDIVCFDPRSVVTEKGYIKSRFLDDKLSCGILLGLAKLMRDEHLTPSRRVYAHVTVYEEVGHGGSASVPDGVTEAISIDMGCVGDGISCTERQVSICAKDSHGPYSYEVIKKLISAARSEGADYAVDVYPKYGSDVERTLYAGYDVRHGLLGAGVFASHGYERSHKDGVENALKTLKGYLGL
ncbi:MAG TPA: M42 family metallopeptidase [Eubacteriales bacterium]|nr:M42 family metallopeptidase [Clostridia bacterium]HRV73193.1 M42 family metallopeptidase [Eubacteriales bacterium]